MGPGRQQRDALHGAILLVATDRAAGSLAGPWNRQVDRVRIIPSNGLTVIGAAFGMVDCSR